MQIKREFLTDRQGKTFVLYAGLLDAAHGAGLTGIATELVQRPSPENGEVAIVYATVTLVQDGVTKTFCGIGDASPANVGRMIASHTIRMAETRAKARALRDAINVGVAAVEELGDDERHEAPTGAVAGPPERSAPPSRRMTSGSPAASPSPAPSSPPATGARGTHAAAPPSNGQERFATIEHACDAMSVAASLTDLTHIYNVAKHQFPEDYDTLREEYKRLARGHQGLAPQEARA